MSVTDCDPIMHSINGHANETASDSGCRWSDWLLCVCSLVRKSYMELALVCFGSCQFVQLVPHGSLLPRPVDESAQSSSQKFSQQVSWHLPVVVAPSPALPPYGPI